MPVPPRAASPPRRHPKTQTATQSQPPPPPPPLLLPLPARSRLPLPVVTPPMPQRRLAPTDERRGRPDRRRAVDDCARRGVARPLLAAAEEGLGVTLLVQVPPRRALVRFWLIYLGSICGRLVIFGFGVSGRAHWIPSADGVVLMLIGANVAVFMLWRLADPMFMRNHFMVSDQARDYHFGFKSG